MSELTTLDKKICSRVTTARLLCAEDQATFAKGCSISRARVCSYESENNSFAPGLDKLFSIAQHSGVSLDWLLGNSYCDRILDNNGIIQITNHEYLFFLIYLIENLSIESLTFNKGSIPQQSIFDLFQDPNISEDEIRSTLRICANNDGSALVLLLHKFSEISDIMLNKLKALDKNRMFDTTNSSSVGELINYYRDVEVNRIHALSESFLSRLTNIKIHPIDTRYANKQFDRNVIFTRLKELCNNYYQGHISDFARALGLDGASLSRYMRLNLPSAEILLNISRNTGVSLDWICGLSDYKTMSLTTYSELFSFMFRLCPITDINSGRALPIIFDISSLSIDIPYDNDTVTLLREIKDYGNDSTIVNHLKDSIDNSDISHRTILLYKADPELSKYFDSLDSLCQKIDNL